jgi:hypothetical protein
MNAWRTSSGRDRKAAKEGKLDPDFCARQDSTNLRMLHPDVDRELRRTKKKRNWKTRRRPIGTISTIKFFRTT